MTINKETTGIEGIELLPTDLLIDILKNKATQIESEELEGFYILRLQKSLGLKKQKEIAEIIDKSPSYVSLRIRKAKENLNIDKKSRGRGRIGFEDYNLDEMIGDDIPLRVQSKVGIMPTKDLADFLKKLAIDINAYEDELTWDVLNQSQIGKDKVKSSKGRKRFMKLTPELDHDNHVLDNKYPLRLISKEGELDKMTLVEYLEEAAIRLYTQAQNEVHIV